MKSLLFKNADWAAEREYRIVGPDWADEAPCAIPLDGCVTGIAFGPLFPAHHLLVAEAIRERFGLSDLHVA